MGESIEKAISRSVRIAELESELARLKRETERLKALMASLREGIRSAITAYEAEYLIEEGGPYYQMLAGLLAAIDEATQETPDPR